jgi:hypothetical protein
MQMVDPTYCKRKVLDLHGEYGAQTHRILSGYWNYEHHGGQAWKEDFAVAELYDELG